MMNKLLLLLYTGHYNEEPLRVLASSNVLELEEADIIDKDLPDLVKMHAFCVRFGNTS